MWSRHKADAAFLLLFVVVLSVLVHSFRAITIKYVDNNENWGHKHNSSNLFISFAEFFLIFSNLPDGDVIFALIFFSFSFHFFFLDNLLSFFAAPQIKNLYSSWILVVWFIFWKTLSQLKVKLKLISWIWDCALVSYTSSTHWTTWLITTPTWAICSEIKYSPLVFVLWLNRLKCFRWWRPRWWWCW